MATSAIILPLTKNWVRWMYASEQRHGSRGVLITRHKDFYIPFLCKNNAMEDVIAAKRAQDFSVG